MAAKQIAYDIDARERMLRGIHKLSKAVKVTLGPSGRDVIQIGRAQVLNPVNPTNSG